MVHYGEYELVSSAPLAPDIRDVTVYCPEAAKTARAGQFAQIFTNSADMLLPRPISICETGADTIRFVFRVIGGGTARISRVRPGRRLRLAVPLGNGFPLTKKPRVAVVGGGLGVPPLLMLARDLAAGSPGRKIDVFLGFSGKPFLTEDFARAARGARIYTATDDGLEGERGTAADLLARAGDYDVVYACGPKPMLKAVNEIAGRGGARLFVSVEERMACGVGACLGCAVKVKSDAGFECKGHEYKFEYKKVCSDGPVFDAADIIWD